MNLYTCRCRDLCVWATFWLSPAACHIFYTYLRCAVRSNICIIFIFCLRTPHSRTALHRVRRINCHVHRLFCSCTHVLILTVLRIKMHLRLYICNCKVAATYLVTLGQTSRLYSKYISRFDWSCGKWSHLFTVCMTRAVLRNLSSGIHRYIGDQWTLPGQECGQTHNSGNFWHDFT